MFKLTIGVKKTKVSKSNLLILCVYHKIIECASEWVLKVTVFYFLQDCCFCPERNLAGQWGAAWGWSRCFVSPNYELYWSLYVTLSDRNKCNFHISLYTKQAFNNSYVASTYLYVHFGISFKKVDGDAKMHKF